MREEHQSVIEEDTKEHEEAGFLDNQHFEFECEQNYFILFYFLKWYKEILDVE